MNLRDWIGRTEAVTDTVAPTPYAALFELNWLSASGTACLLATILAALVLRVPGKIADIYRSTFKQLKFALLTIASMLGLAYLMNYSGMTSTLGLALAATGPAFPFFSATVGWLGVFLTGSDTSANALFGNLQVVTANALGLNPILTASVNSAAGVMGKMISVQSIAVAIAATILAEHAQSLFDAGLRRKNRSLCALRAEPKASALGASIGPTDRAWPVLSVVDCQATW